MSTGTFGRSTSRSPSPSKVPAAQASFEAAPSQAQGPEEEKKAKPESIHRKLDGPNPFFKFGMISKKKIEELREVFNREANKRNEDDELFGIDLYLAWQAIEGMCRSAVEDQSKIEKEMKWRNHLDFGSFCSLYVLVQPANVAKNLSYKY